MKQKKEYRTNRMLRAAAVLLCLVLISAGMLTGLLARYMSGASGREDARVASFQVSADMEQFEETYTLQISPGKEQAYSFRVSNEGETAVVIQALLQTEGNLPLQMECGKGSDSSAVTWSTVTENIQETGGDAAWEDTLLPGNSAGETYQIRISWPETANGYQYANGVESVRLTVTASQAE